MAETARQEVIEVLDRYFAAYEKLDLDVCKAIWDTEYPALSWKPTEREDAMTDYAEIERYLDGNHRIDLHDFRPSSYKVVDVIRPDVAFVFAHMICRFDIPDNAATRKEYEQGGLVWGPGHQVRWKGAASFVLHKRDGAWKLIHYEDSTLWNLVNNED
jgi:hypothetical protein